MTRCYRIFIFGGVCSGKTFLANRLAEELRIRPLHLDNEFWFGNWQNIGTDALIEYARKEASNPQWIIEGNYPRVRDAIWQACTHIVYVDVPPWRATLRAFRRSMDRSRPGVPVKVREVVSRGESPWELLRMIRRHASRKRIRDLQFLAGIRGRQVQVATVRYAKDQERLIRALLCH